MSINNPKKRYLLITDFALTKGDKGDIGATGPPGAGASLPINTSDSIHDGVERTGELLNDLLDDLLYVDLLVTSFNTSVKKFEIGSVLTSMGVTWVINKTITAQTISGAFIGTPPTLNTTQRSVTITLDNANVDFTIQIEADDGTGNPLISAFLSIDFAYPVYYGKAIIPGAVNSAFLNGLSKKLQDTIGLSFTVTLGAAEFGWYAVRSTLVSGGDPTFIINGFLSSMLNISTFSHTNAAGHVEDYTVYRTEFSNLGITTIEAQ
jgi:hypothetical protein